MGNISQDRIGVGNHLANKGHVYQVMAELADSKAETLKECLKKIYADDAHWRGSHPLNELNGIEAIHDTVWAPLKRSFPDIERRDLIVNGGEYLGSQLVACMGHYLGTFSEPWLGIPATGHPVFIRYGEVHVLKDGKVVQSSCIWDVMDVMRQAGFWPIAPSTGIECMWSGPITGDGIVLHETDPDEGAANLVQTRAMQECLMEYNAEFSREYLLSMPQKDYWHPKMMWYGPSGIGTIRGLAGFVDFHQLPFRLAFPARQAGQKLSETKKGGHYIRIGDGKYSVTGGWPSVISPHDGGHIMGMPATGKMIEMRVMDFYLHHEGLIRENWVPIDTIHMLLQMGVDVFDRMTCMFKRGF